MNLNERIKLIAEELATRESARAEAIDQARNKAIELHDQVDSAIAIFNRTIADDAPYLCIDLSPTRVDDKHLHSIEFDLQRGRHRAVVTVKSKGVVTLVGPFRAGKKEGPCLSFPMGETEEINDALGDFLERFLEEAATP